MIIRLIITILIGALCGWIAGKIFKGKGFGFWINCLVGIVGSWLGNFLLGSLIGGSLIGGIITSVIGAIILLWIISLIRKK